jgi:hypothetical protein
MSVSLSALRTILHSIAIHRWKARAILRPYIVVVTMITRKIVLHNMFYVKSIVSAKEKVCLDALANMCCADADAVLQRLDGLPLALTQAGAYMRETNMSAATLSNITMQHGSIQ